MNFWLFVVKNQQSEIDLMKEGSDKKIAQINLDYDNEIAAILAKEKEWKDAARRQTEQRTDGRDSYRFGQFIR